MTQILQYNQIDRQQWTELLRTSETGTWFQSPEAYDFFASMPELMEPFVYGVVKDEKLCEKKDELCERLNAFGLLGFTKAVMYALKVVFNLDERYFLVDPDEKIGQMLIEEILMTGNFGQNDSRFGNLKEQSRISRLSALLKKNLRFWRYFLGEVLFAFLFRVGQPFWRYWTNIKYS